MTQTIAAVLWDMDGTLIDSERLHYEVLAEQCRAEGLPWSWEDNEAVMGATMDEKWRHLNQLHHFSCSREDWLQEFNRLYKERLAPELGLPQQVQAVLRLHDRRMPLACVSNGEREVVEANLEALDIAHCFNVVVANGDAPRGKPWPDPYLLACQRLKCTPSSCLAVEDSPLGVAAALAAGLVTVVWPHASALPWQGPQAHHMVLEQGFPWELVELQKDQPGKENKR